jgi:hypothetical protein
MAIFRPKPSQIFFFGLVPKSPIHIGLIYVKNPKPNISCLGPFNKKLPVHTPPGCFPRAVYYHHEALEAHPETHGVAHGVMNAHLGASEGKICVLEAYFEVVEVSPRTLEAHPRAVKAYCGNVETHTKVLGSTLELLDSIWSRAFS